jgi:hypothetical protein
MSGGVEDLANAGFVTHGEGEGLDTFDDIERRKSMTPPETKHPVDATAISGGNSHEPSTEELIAKVDRARSRADSPLNDWELVAVKLALRRLAAMEKAAPDGYVYRYVDPLSGDPVIVNNSGETWNGQSPREAIPYFYRRQP